MKSKRFVPKEGEMFYRIKGILLWKRTLRVSSEKYSFEKFGNASCYFKTKKQATDALKKIKKILRGE